MSGFPHPWLVSFASPFEVFAEDDPSGESTFEMGTLPPGLYEIEECAVVSVDQDGNQTIVTVWPAMLESLPWFPVRRRIRLALEKRLAISALPAPKSPR